jgi:hypothetical protein
LALVNTDGALAPLFRLHARLGPRLALVVIWSTIGLAAVAQRWLERALDGGDNDLRAVGVDVWLLVLWAVATPTILSAARKYPIRAHDAPRHAVVHLGSAVAFIVVTNVVIRLPMLWWPPTDIAVVGRDLGAGLVRFGPTALLVYAAIVGIGHLTRTAERPAYPERITVREWNRARLVRAADVEWIESDDNYVIVQVAGRTLKGRGRISELETQLDPARFVRIHRSAIVARASVREVQSLAKGNLALLMNDGKLLRVARTRRGALESMLATH